MFATNFSDMLTVSEDFQRRTHMYHPPSGTCYEEVPAYITYSATWRIHEWVQIFEAGAGNSTSV
jgi:hypothetical protein